MLQRIQTLYLLAAFGLCIACLCSPIAHFLVTGTDEIIDMYNLWLVSAEGAHMFSFCPVLMVLLLITATALFLDVWLFTRRALQMRLATFCMLLLIAWNIVYGILTFLLSTEMQATWRPHWTAALPAASLILTYLAFRGILKDDMLVRSLDRLR
ncbi:MAG: DUF4293 domain-containing protein [Prevotellaceae bacterium]|nr:DUF4293 domain-containing protein [Prevotellaceae bacterium]